MIKKIVFDLDNTLLEWKDEYIFALAKVIKKLNLNYNDEKIKEIDRAITDYENHFNFCTKESFLNFINEECNVKLPLEFVDLLIDEQGKCFEEYTGKKLETIKYLSKKYELICITNWFTKTQALRLNNAKIGKYFSLISGGDEHELKPSLKAFDMIDKPEECVMVGDRLKFDIYPALNVGMQGILLTNKHMKKNSRYKIIKKLEDLKEML